MSEYSKGIMIDEECFKCLVSGGVIHSGKIRIALSDIGFSVMHRIIEEAQYSQGELDKIYKDYIKDE